jgi:hypothetical protein
MIYIVKIQTFLRNTFKTFLRTLKDGFSSFSRSMTKERVIILSLFVISLLVRIIYFSHTGPFERTADAPGHFEYIEFISENMSLPAINELEQSYHPPLYYVVSAVFHKVLSLFHFTVNTINRVLQFLSLCFHLGFLISGTMILKRYISNKPVFFLCTALLYFWPSSILHSARIGNDNLYYCFYGFSILFLCKWYDDEKTVNCALFTLCALLCIFTKVNGIVILGCFGILVIIKFFLSKEKKQFVVKILPAIVILLLGFSGLFVFQVIDTIQGYKVITFANRAQVMGWGATIGVDAKNYLYFDMGIFINEPFTDMFADWGGRQYFWNYLLKTSLFGEFTAESAFLKNCATILSFLLVLLTGIMILGIMTLRFPGAKERLPIFLNLIFLVLSSAAFRYLSPITCSNDFRYIFPVIITLPVFLGSAMAFFRRNNLVIFSYVTYGTSAVFIVVSIIFYVMW